MPLKIRLKPGKKLFTSGTGWVENVGGRPVDLLISSNLVVQREDRIETQERKDHDSLDKYRYRDSPVRSARPTFSRTDTSSDPAEDDQNDLIDENEPEEEEEKELSESYTARWQCTNCGYDQDDEFPYGERIEECDKECKKCGCY